MIDTDRLCKCGHYESEHTTYSRVCEGHVGNDVCTCLYFKPVKEK